MDDKMVVSAEQVTAIRVVYDKQNDMVQLQNWVGGYSHPPMSLWDRTKLAAQIMWTGEPYPDFFNLTREGAVNLADTLKEEASQGDETDHKSVKGFNVRS